MASFFTKVSMREGIEYSICISNVIGPFDFYCQQLMNEQSLIDLTNTIANAPLSPPPSFIRAFITPILVRYSVDGMLYRAIVMEWLSENDCTVMFVDYGNTENKKRHELMCLPSELSKLPAQAVHCSLDPKVLSDKCAARFLSLDMERVTLKVLRIERLGVENLYVVDLSRGNDSLIEDFSKEFPAVTSAPQIMSAPQPPDASGDDMAVWGETLELGTTYNVCLSHQEVTNGFVFVQLISNYEALMNMMETLGDLTSPTPVAKEDVSNGLEGLAIVEKVLYRALVDVVEGDGSSVRVRLVDFGDMVTIPLTALFVLPEECSHVPLLATCCRWPGCRLTIPCRATVIMTQLENERLPDLRILCTDGASPILPMTTEPGGLKNLRPDIKPGLRLHCKIFSSVGPDDLMFAQPKSVLSKVSAHHERVNTFYSSNPVPCIEFPVMDAYCCVLCPKDDKWYRGRIAKIFPSIGEPPDTLVSIVFIDYGNIFPGKVVFENVKVRDVRVLTPPFHVLLEQGFECHLNGSTIQNPDGLEKALLSSSLVNLTIVDMSKRELVVSINDSPDNDRFKCFLPGSGVSSKVPSDVPKPPTEVYKQSPASLALASYRQVPLEGTFEGTVTFAESPGRFWCASAGYEAKVEQITTRLFDHMGLGVTRNGLRAAHGTVRVGLLCCALFEGDWYRARILKDNGSTVKILYVDYGNSEIRPQENVFRIPKEFTTEPELTHECCLVHYKEIGREYVPEEIDAVKKFENGGPVKVEVVKAAGRGVTYVDLIDSGGSVSDQLRGLVAWLRIPNSTKAEGIQPYSKDGSEYAQKLTDELKALPSNKARDWAKKEIGTIMKVAKSRTSEW